MHTLDVRHIHKVVDERFFWVLRASTMAHVTCRVKRGGVPGQTWRRAAHEKRRAGSWDHHRFAGPVLGGSPGQAWSASLPVASVWQTDGDANLRQ